MEVVLRKLQGRYSGYLGVNKTLTKPDRGTTGYMQEHEDVVLTI
jgi:hypothetical protein